MNVIRMKCIAYFCLIGCAFAITNRVNPAQLTPNQGITTCPIDYYLREVPAEIYSSIIENFYYTDNYKESNDYFNILFSLRLTNKNLYQKMGEALKHIGTNYVPFQQRLFYLNHLYENDLAKKMAQHISFFLSNRRQDKNDLKMLSILSLYVDLGVKPYGGSFNSPNNILAHLLINEKRDLFYFQPLLIERISNITWTKSHREIIQNKLSQINEGRKIIIERLKNINERWDPRHADLDTLKCKKAYKELLTQIEPLIKV